MVIIVSLKYMPKISFFGDHPKYVARASRREIFVHAKFHFFSKGLEVAQICRFSD